MEQSRSWTWPGSRADGLFWKVTNWQLDVPVLKWHTSSDQSWLDRSSQVVPYPSPRGARSANNQVSSGREQEIFVQQHHPAAHELYMCSRSGDHRPDLLELQPQLGPFPDLRGPWPIFTAQMYTIRLPPSLSPRNLWWFCQETLPGKEESPPKLPVTIDPPPKMELIPW